MTVLLAAHNFAGVLKRMPVVLEVAFVATSFIQAPHFCMVFCNWFRDAD